MSRFTKIHPLEITTGYPKSPNQKLSDEYINLMRDKNLILPRDARKLKKAKTPSEQSKILYEADEKIKRDKADTEACERDCRGPMCIAKAMCCAAGVACVIGSACGMGRKNKKCKKRTKRKGRRKGKKTKGGRKRKKRTRKRRSRRTKRRRTRK